MSEYEYKQKIQKMQAEIDTLRKTISLLSRTCDVQGEMIGLVNARVDIVIEHLSKEAKSKC